LIAVCVILLGTVLYQHVISNVEALANNSEAATEAFEQRLSRLRALMNRYGEHLLRL